MTDQQSAAPNFPAPDDKKDPVGIGLRHAYYREILEDRPAIGWLEIHPENYFGGGAPRHILEEIAAHYPISMHGVGLSLGSDQPVSKEHLAALCEVANICKPFLISEHAAWSASGNAHLNDLLPLPYTREVLSRLCDNIARTQDALGRQILLENPSTYIAWSDNDMSEPDFLNRAAQATGCGLLLDVNNIFVQSVNHRFNPFEYLKEIEFSQVGEIHLAGHTERTMESGQRLLIDSHNSAVCTDVWDLYRAALARAGRSIPTLIEWDQDFPALDVLLEEAAAARSILRETESEKRYEAA